jgi:uncharacterized protein YoxC
MRGHIAQIAGATVSLLLAGILFEAVGSFSGVGRALPQNPEGTASKNQAGGGSTSGNSVRTNGGNSGQSQAGGAASGPGSTPSGSTKLDASSGSGALGTGSSPNGGGSQSGNVPNSLGDLRASTIVLAAAGALVLIMLFLHLLHFISASGLKQDLYQISATVRTLSRDMQGITNSGARVSHQGTLQSEITRQWEELQQLGEQLRKMDSWLQENQAEIDRTSEAVAMSVRLTGESRLRSTPSEGRGAIDRADRAEVIKVVGQYKEMCSANAKRVQPLAIEVRRLCEMLRIRPAVPREFAARVNDLNDGIQQFERWYVETGDRMASLEGGSMADRHSGFRAREGELARQLELGSISITDYVRRYRDLMEQSFPQGMQDGYAALSVADHEQDLKTRQMEVPRYLMDWFDGLVQLQSQVSASSDWMDDQVAAALVRIQQLGREALGRFDMQPEEIQVGQTTFDRRLHDAGLIARSPQYPSNTVIGIQQCGFRKISTGEVLRRPKVVVAGVGVV